MTSYRNFIFVKVAFLYKDITTFKILSNRNPKHTPISKKNVVLGWFEIRKVWAQGVSLRKRNRVTKSFEQDQGNYIKVNHDGRKFSMLMTDVAIFRFSSKIQQGSY